MLLFFRLTENEKQEHQIVNTSHIIKPKTKNNFICKLCNLSFNNKVFIHFFWQFNIYLLCMFCLHRDTDIASEEKIVSPPTLPPLINNRFPFVNNVKKKFYQSVKI